MNLDLGREEKAYISILAFVVLVPLGLNYFILDTVVTTHQAELNVTEEVNGSSLYVGINADKSLEFGTLINGTNATKTIRLESQGEALVDVISRGNISRYLMYDHSFVMNGEKKLYITASAEEPGYYSGKVTIKIQSADTYIGRKWIDLKSSLY
ncbi:MAG: hypothetical protein ABEJ36_01435 [Candidatus Nanosalina sp.]